MSCLWDIPVFYIELTFYRIFMISNSAVLYKSSILKINVFFSVKPILFVRINNKIHVTKITLIETQH